jgi:hypothetical protein
MKVDGDMTEFTKQLYCSKQLVREEYEILEEI